MGRMRRTYLPSISSLSHPPARRLTMQIRTGRRVISTTHLYAHLGNRADMAMRDQTCAQGSLIVFYLMGGNEKGRKRMWFIQRTQGGMSEIMCFSNLKMRGECQFMFSGGYPPYVQKPLRGAISLYGSIWTPEENHLKQRIAFYISAQALCAKFISKNNLMAARVPLGLHGKCLHIQILEAEVNKAC